MDDKRAAEAKKVFGYSADQYILNVVKESCQRALALPSFTGTLQTIKSHFYDRNYDAVFQNPDHLPVYTARYAPSRALCYYHMFLQHPVLLKTLEGGPSNILCIGSGAGSELVGIAAAMVHANPIPKTKKKKTTASTTDEKKKKSSKDKKSADGIEGQEEQDDKGKEVLKDGKDTTLGLENLAMSSTTSMAEAGVEGGAGAGAEVEAGEAKTPVTKKKPKSDKHQVKLVMQDYVDWTPILEPMEQIVRTRMHLGPERLQCETEVGNVLDLSDSLLDRIAAADLITFMFVLNELFQDKKRTMLLVARVVAAMPKGAHMLVVDSAGSFSNLKVGERTYMMYMLLDHLKDLEIVYQDDATWYRCPPGLTYPLKLENMRHFVRIYRKL
ncbi:hypothetical protein BG011_000615 [Mortierella polycephala]|uniref:Uncharacterized protein n=1 Tax=Mortierella polycephala TaxID=41804 RepID=A0A9P6U701_9FUNG|nr:hypothetical protein BG011_000615 [Mortierella polycephala]